MDEVELTQRDYDAADEVLRLIAGRIEVDGNEREILARKHAQMGEIRFGLLHGLREPQTKAEELVIELLDGRTTKDDFKKRMHERTHRPVDLEMMESVFSHIYELLQIYSDALGQIIELCQEGLSFSERSKLARQISASFERLKEKSSLSIHEWQTTFSFLQKMRIQKGLGVPMLEQFMQPTVELLALNAFEIANERWINCMNTAKGLGIGSPSMRPVFAARLFAKQTQHCKLPAPQHLQALLMEEEVAAIMHFEELSNAVMQPTNIKVESATIYATSTQLYSETIHVNQKTNQEETAPQKEFLLSVDNWSELAIGIDDNWRYWAVTPAPLPGKQFPKSKAVELPLNGKQWKAILDLLGRSTDMELVSLQDVMRALDKLQPDASESSDKRAKPRELEAEVLSQLKTKILAAREPTRKALNDLSSKLGEFVQGPKGRNDASLSVDGKFVRCRFRVRFLLPNEDRTYRFGDPIPTSNGG